MLLGETVLSMLASSIFAQSPLKVENPAPFISGLLQAKVFVVTPFLSVFSSFSTSTILLFETVPLAKLPPSFLFISAELRVRSILLPSTITIKGRKSLLLYSNLPLLSPFFEQPALHTSITPAASAANSFLAFIASPLHRNSSRATPFERSPLKLQNILFK